MRCGARGFVRLAGLVPVPARIGAVVPGRSWEWTVGPVSMRHQLQRRPSGCAIQLQLSAPPPLEATVAAVYGPVVGLVLRRLARVAADVARESDFD